jgi:hypothetical protein
VFFHSFLVDVTLDKIEKEIKNERRFYEFFEIGGPCVSSGFWIECYNVHSCNAGVADKHENPDVKYSFIFVITTYDNFILT